MGNLICAGGVCVTGPFSADILSWVVRSSLFTFVGMCCGYASLGCATGAPNDGRRPQDLWMKVQFAVQKLASGRMHMHEEQRLGTTVRNVDVDAEEIVA